MVAEKGDRGMMEEGHLLFEFEMRKRRQSETSRKKKEGRVQGISRARKR